MPIQKFWNLKKTGNNAELMIYGEISDMVFWGDEVVPKDIDNELKAMGDVSEIVVRINSPGGSYFSGVAIHTMLSLHKATKTVHVEGVAASAASFIAMVGDKIIMEVGSMMMIHRASLLMFGNADDFMGAIEKLNKVDASMTSIYVARTGKTAEEIKAMLAAETWFTAQEAVDSGFATEIGKSSKIAACIRDKTAIINGVEMDWTKFFNAPKLPAEKPIVANGRNLDLEYRSLELY